MKPVAALKHEEHRTACRAIPVNKIIGVKKKQIWNKSVCPSTRGPDSGHGLNESIKKIRTLITANATRLNLGILSLFDSDLKHKTTLNKPRYNNSVIKKPYKFGRLDLSLQSTWVFFFFNGSLLNVVLDGLVRFLELHVVTLWRVDLARWRGVGGELSSLSDSDGSVSVCGEPVSPTSSLRNLNLDKKSCHTTYQPAEWVHMLVTAQKMKPTPVYDVMITVPAFYYVNICIERQICSTVQPTLASLVRPVTLSAPGWPQCSDPPTPKQTSEPTGGGGGVRRHLYRGLSTLCIEPATQ